MKNSISKKIILNNYKKADGKNAILLQVIINRKRHALSTGLSIQSYLFNKTTGKVKHNNSFTKEQAVDYNLMLENMLFKAHKVIMRATLDDDDLTYEYFKEKFYSQNNLDEIDFINFMFNEIKKLTTARAIGSIKSYQKTHKKLKDFRPKLLFSKINKALIEDFDRYLIKNNLAPNTRALHHKNFKFFINIAINRDVKIINPYNSFKIKRIKGNRGFLNKQELDNLKQLYLSNDLNIELQNVLSYFLFSCYTGLRISDVQVIKSENIINNILVFTPIKTKNTRKIIKIPLPNFAIKLINGKKGKLFNTITDQATNRALKDIAAAATIKKNLTFHVARHTFATTFLRIGGSVEVLQKLLGHSKLETTMEYVHIMEDTLIEQMANFNK